MNERSGEWGAIARQLFEEMRNCGDEVRELLQECCMTTVRPHVWWAAAKSGRCALRLCQRIQIARKRGILPRFMPCEAETGNGHKHLSANEPDRSGLRGHQGTCRNLCTDPRKRQVQKSAMPASPSVSSRMRPDLIQTRDRRLARVRPTSQGRLVDNYRRKADSSFLIFVNPQLSPGGRRSARNPNGHIRITRRPTANLIENT
jgi:hypothetical protein